MELISKVSVLLSLILVLQLHPVVCIRNLARVPKNKHESYSSTKEDDLVSNLPGQPEINFQHYAGYVTVNEENGRALFYWFYEAFSQHHHKPLVLWLNGGPGCSSVGYGATQEIGPFILDSNGQLQFNSYAWNREANMLFVESPVGVGFSYSNTSSDYDILGDPLAAQDAYAFLHNWFLKFPSYRNRAFYIAGESYAGKYVPELAEIIHDKNKDPSLYINLKGILLGNPETSDPDDNRGMVDYAWSHGVISDETHKLISKSCDFHSDHMWSNHECSNAMGEMMKQYQQIDINSLYTPICIGTYTESQHGSLTQAVFKRSSTMMPKIIGRYDPCFDNLAKSLYNQPDVQRALHVSDGLQLRNWTVCNETVYNKWNWKLAMPSVLPIYHKLIAAGVRIWVYNGDTDGRVPVLSTRYSINALRLPITKAWRPWYHEGQVSGWCQEYQGLTYATFRGAGHTVPVFKPSESLALFSSFLQGQTLPSARYDN